MIDVIIAIMLGINVVILTVDVIHRLSYEEKLKSIQSTLNWHESRLSGLDYAIFNRKD